MTLGCKEILQLSCGCLTIDEWTIVCMERTTSACDMSVCSGLLVLGNLDLHVLELEFLTSTITVSLQVGSLGEVELPCECPNCSVTSTR